MRGPLTLHGRGTKCNEETGQVVISKKYSGRNAMGGTVSGKYECTVDAASNRVVGLKTRDAFGVHTIA